MRRRTLAIGGAAVLQFAVVSAACAFGGEDVVTGDPWHHEDMTRRALMGSPPIYEGAGFSRGAADSAAWHADYIDSYLYNPIFWLRGGASTRRLKASLVGFAELSKLHFDDTFTPEGIRANWRRYFAGTLAGLYWASLRVEGGQRGDIAAAHHILGVSVHAVQDFYSHTNWIDDPDRRCMTWFQIPPEERHALPSIYSGAYEQPHSRAPHHHGAYAFACTLLRGETLDEIMEPMCGSLSPVQNISICDRWRYCTGSQPITVSAFGRAPEGVVMLHPPGIAMDTTWMARVQAPNRQLVDVESLRFSNNEDGLYFPRPECPRIIGTSRDDVCSNDADMLFAGAKDLAIRATMEWVKHVEQAVKAMGPDQAAFWERIKRERTVPPNAFDSPIGDAAERGAELLSQVEDGTATEELERLLEQTETRVTDTVEDATETLEQDLEGATEAIESELDRIESDPEEASGGLGDGLDTATQQVTEHTDRLTSEGAGHVEQVTERTGSAVDSVRDSLEPDSGPHTAQFEDFSKLPYQFLSAGPYPIANAVGPGENAVTSADGWYLRLRMTTGSAFGDGTDADIYVEVSTPGRPPERHLLDYLPITDPTGRTDNPLLVYDDFEEGDDDAYMIGPFAARPSAIRFINDAADAVEVVSALADSLAISISNSVTGLRRDFISLFAGKADYVGSKQRTFTHRQIADALARSPNAFEQALVVDGGDEGSFVFEARFRPVAFTLTDEERAAGWLAIEVSAHRLRSLEESNDRGTPSDEPFVMFLVAPNNGRGDPYNTYLSDPIPDMDRHDIHVFPRESGSYHTVKVPPNGSVILSLQVFESDFEQERDREMLKRMFETGLDAEDIGEQGAFLGTTGAFLGADWRLQYIEAFAFRRADVPEAGPVLPRTLVGDIPEDTASRQFALDWGQVRPLLGADLAIDAWTSDLPSPWTDQDEETEQSPRIASRVGGSITASIGGSSQEIEVRRCSREH